MTCRQRKRFNGPNGQVFIVSAARTPIGKFNGSLADVPATTLGGIAIRAAVERAGVATDQVDEVLMGQVLQAGVGQAPARQAALNGGLADSTSATTINRVCGSGLKAIMLGAAEIRAGDAEIVVAGGMENMNQGPYLIPKASFGYRLGNAELIDATVHDGLWCSTESCHMGTHAERVAMKAAGQPRRPGPVRGRSATSKALEPPSTPAASPTRSSPCPVRKGTRRNDLRHRRGPARATRASRRWPG